VLPPQSKPHTAAYPCFIRAIRSCGKQDLPFVLFPRNKVFIQTSVTRVGCVGGPGMQLVLLSCAQTCFCAQAGEVVLVTLSVLKVV
jgi:hypothetical protein